MLSRDIVLEDIILKEKSLIGKKHPSYHITSEDTKYDLSGKQLPIYYCDGRVIGNERYIKVTK